MLISSARFGQKQTVEVTGCRPSSQSGGSHVPFEAACSFRNAVTELTLDPTLANMIRSFIARTLSLIGHPALLTPVAALLSAMINNAPANALQLLIFVSCCTSASVITYCWIQVRSGRWLHVDASLPRERRQLHSVLSLLFFGIAISLWLFGQSQRIVLGPAFCGLLIVFASLCRHFLKISLHASLAVFAASLLWPNVVSTSVFLLLALAVSWSRLALHRHTRQEVVIGLLLGGTTGLAFNVVSSA